MRLPPERLRRAIVSGVRYAFHSPAIRIVLARSLIIGTLGCVLAALMPLIARDLLHGDAQTYGGRWAPLAWERWSGHSISAG